MTSSDAPERVALAEVIKGLRKEIAEAMDAGEDASLQFEVNHIEIELQTIIEKNATVESEVKGALKFLVEVGAGLKGSETNRTAQGHLIRLNVTPLKRGTEKRDGEESQRVSLASRQ